MDNQLACSLCDELYQADNLPRLLTGCGHTFCEKCLKKMMLQNNGSFKIMCPEDGEKYEFEDDDISNFPKNLALIKIMDSKKGNSSFKDSSFEVSKIVKSGSVEDDEDARDLMDAIGQTKQVAENEEKEEMCQVHKKPLEVVCILDLKKICANCAIFGEHKGHEFKSLEQIQQEATVYYSEILSIMDKKETIIESLSNEDTCTEIMGILTTKKQKLKKSITLQYKKLLDAVQQRQKESLKQLDAVTEKAEVKLKSLMKIQPNLMTKYLLWEDKSYEKIQVLGGNNFDEKLQLLFRESSDSVDVVEEGEGIIEDMKSQEDNLLREAEVALESLGVDFNNQIFNHIQSFVDVFDEVKKKKPKSRMNKETPAPSKPAPKKQVTISHKTPPKIIPEPQLAEKIEPEMNLNIEDDQDDLLNDEPYVKKPEFFSNQESTKIEQSLTEQAPQIKQKREMKMQSPPVADEVREMRGSSITKKKDNSFCMQRPSKKKLSKIKFPEKYEKIADALANDTLELVDFTNAELGDNTIVIISEFLNGSKAKTVKFIRNKINDETVAKMLPYLSSVITLNLSQNFLTDHVIDILIKGRHHLPAMKNIILSLNKISERKHKSKLDKLRALDLIVSV